jgi:hypothetical protein
MNTTFYQSSHYLAARPAVGDAGRVATTITLIAVATCMVLAKSFAVTRPPDAQRGAATAVRIVDPDFCKNQTWPYIDTRCLKRVAPDMPAAENQTANLPSTTGPGIIPASSEPTPAPTAPLAIAAVNGAPASGSASATGGTVQSTPPTPIMNGAAQNDIQETIAPNTAITATDNPANVRVADSHRSHRSQHRQHGAFFGFRF